MTARRAVRTNLDAPLVPRRVVLAAAGLVGAVVVGWVLLDVLVTTDEERLETYADGLGGTIDDVYISRALAWVDPSEVELEVHAQGGTRAFRASDAEALRAAARRGLARYVGTTARVLRRSVRVDGDEGSIHVELLTDQGMVTVDLELVRREERWLVAAARVS